MAPRFQDIVEEARLSARALLDFGEQSLQPDGAARRHRPVTRRQDRVHHGARPRPDPRRALSGVRVARDRPDRARPARAAARRCGAALRLRKPPPHPDRRAALAELDVDISELRLVIDYQRQNGADRTLTLDIVDYPGEWLLDLPLLNKTYEQWSAESLALSRRARARSWRRLACASCDAERRRPRGRTGGAGRGKTVHRLSARLPRRTLRHEPVAARPLPDAGQLAGSPALTFAPLDVPADGTAPDGRCGR